MYSTDKYRRRGEFGELLLHAALVDFYGAEPAVSKIWLGEAKFYSAFDDAMDSVLKDIQAHRPLIFCAVFT